MVSEKLTYDKTCTTQGLQQKISLSYNSSGKKHYIAIYLANRPYL